MKPENRALLVLVLVAVVVTAAVGAYLLVSPREIPVSLPVPSGTAFSSTDSVSWIVYFNVSTPDVKIAGAWTAYQGIGFVGLVVVNGSVAKPSGLYFNCPLLQRWSQSNGSIEVPVDPGPHTLYWSAGLCSSASKIVVTEAIRLVGPAGLIWTVRA